MKNVAIVVVALGTLVACNNSRPNVVDSGMITIGDSGGGHDAGGGGGHDAAMSGACNVAIAMTGIGSLMGGCFPRCSQATVDAINACPTTDDGTCLNAALDADTTPGVAWSQNGMPATNPLDCGTCFGVQQFHCLSANGCNSEVVALITCQQSATPPPPCMNEGTMLNTCAMAHNAAIDACFMDATMGVQACFGG